MGFAEELRAATFDPGKSPFFARVHEYLRKYVWAAQGLRRSLVDRCLEKVIAGDALEEPDAYALFDEVIGGQLSDDQIGAVLVAMRPEALSPSTMAAFAKVLRKAGDRVTVAPGEVLGDTCGTGSDTLGTYNVSTTIMFVLAAAGVKIAKHGNRAVTSRCGSADVLEALDVVIDLDAPRVGRCIREVGLGFMFAPVFHRALRNVQRIRHTLAAQMPANLQARTVFNVLGPLANPAGAQWQIIGVYDKDLVPKIGEVLNLLGVERALVAYGFCDGFERGLDEFSTAGETYYVELRDHRLTEHSLEPRALGISRADPKDYVGGDAKTNASILTRILAGEETGARMDLALLNAGAGLYLGGKADGIGEGLEQARAVIGSGAALRKLREFRDKTQELRPRVRAAR